MRYLVPLLLLCLASAHAVEAHPMPNTEISVRLGESVVTLEIRIPVPELALALPASARVNPGRLLPDSRGAVEAYFKDHLNVLSESDAAQDYDITSLTVSAGSDEFVGDYQEMLLTIEVPVRGGFNPRNFLLRYDAVMHQVPNHFALVKVTQDFNNGVFGENHAFTVGAIRYDFSSRSVPPLAVTAADGGAFKGFYGVVALGMHHILVGTDHVLFLLTLLAVAPLAAMSGTWSLFQGVRHTLRRFLSVSLAFTVGHSATLVLGAYEVLPVNQQLVEVMIAASILLTSLHAMRPLFPRRETLLALGFGVIHGLAFSEVLKSLQLAPLQKAISILGFNLGIELMQVVFMAAAFPVLLISRHKIYHSLRVIFALTAAVIACVWVIARATGSTVSGVY